MASYEIHGLKFCVHPAHFVVTLSVWGLCEYKSECCMFFYRVSYSIVVVLGIEDIW